MAFFRKDSSLSNDVFESVDAPPAGVNGEEIGGRPETVVEETPSLTSPTMELADEIGDPGAENSQPVTYCLQATTGMQ